MRLVSVTLTNFRGYEAATRIEMADLTAIVGKNDRGKSTILEALDIFFNAGSGTVKLEQGDLCVHQSTEIATIACEFDDLPPTIIVDAVHPTSARQEFLLNANENLEIVKQYNCRAAKLKQDGEVFLRALHPTTAPATELLQKKIGDLKKIADGLGVEAEDQRVSSSFRAAIRGAVGDLQLQEQLIPLDKEDAKNVWESLKTYLPTYALFQSDRASKDGDPEIQSPLKMAVTEALKTVDPELSAVKARVEAQVLEVARRTLDKLREMDPTLASRLHPTFKTEPKFDKCFELNLTGDEDIPINKRGSGVRRLILLNFFRAEAERKQEEKNSPGIIYAIEEPESSQHPNNQKMLMNALLQLSTAENVQVLLTTHVPGTASLLPQDSMRLVTNGPDNRPKIDGPTDDILKQIADEMGVLPDNRVQVLLYVEGPHDVNFLDRIAMVLKSARPEIPIPSTDPRIGIIITGGGNLKHWVNKRYLAGLQKPEVHIYDRDDNVNPPYLNAIQTVNGRGHLGFLTTKREMESYLHHDAIHEGCGHLLTHPNWDWADIPEMLAMAVHNADPASAPWTHVSEDRRKKKCSRAKERLNSDAASKMTLARLRQSDPTNEIEGWFNALLTHLQPLP